jgi:hypothetical protein
MGRRKSRGLEDQRPVHAAPRVAFCPRTCGRAAPISGSSGPSDNMRVPHEMRLATTFYGFFTKLGT